MAFFKNKHVITALIVAPILALISYFSVDYYVSENPHQVKDGQTYTLLAKPNCRWESGQCDLKNGDITLNLKNDTLNYGNSTIQLSANVALKNAHLGISFVKDGQSVPQNMSFFNKEKVWKIDAKDIQKTDYLQLIVGIEKSIFYVQVPATFLYKSPIN
jgi:hypothetical protein